MRVVEWGVWRGLRTKVFQRMKAWAQLHAEMLPASIMKPETLRESSACIVGSYQQLVAYMTFMETRLWQHIDAAWVST